MFSLPPLELEKDLVVVRSREKLEIEGDDIPTRIMATRPTMVLKMEPPSIICRGDTFTYVM